jgi:hypothetical protein
VNGDVAVNMLAVASCRQILLPFFRYSQQLKGFSEIIPKMRRCQPLSLYCQLAHHQWMVSNPQRKQMSVPSDPPASLGASVVAHSDGRSLYDIQIHLQTLGDALVTGGLTEARSSAEIAIPSAVAFCAELQRLVDMWCEKLSNFAGDYSTLKVFRCVIIGRMEPSAPKFRSFTLWIPDRRVYVVARSGLA